MSLEQFNPSVHRLRVVNDEQGEHVEWRYKGFLNSRPIRWLLQLVGCKIYDLNKVEDVLLKTGSPENCRSVFTKICEAAQKDVDETKSQTKTRGTAELVMYLPIHSLFSKLKSSVCRSTLPKPPVQCRQIAWAA